MVEWYNNGDNSKNPKTFISEAERKHATLLVLALKMKNEFGDSSKEEFYKACFENNDKYLLNSKLPQESFLDYYKIVESRLEVEKNSKAAEKTVFGEAANQLVTSVNQLIKEAENQIIHSIGNN